MIHRILCSIGIASVLALSSACTHEQSAPGPAVMSTSDHIPAAMGDVEVSDAGNGNTLLHVEVAHLAPPQKIASGATTYVVWARGLASNGKPQNVGALAIDPNENGQLHTVTPLSTFDVWITAEPSGSVAEPSGEKLLWARIGR